MLVILALTVSGILTAEEALTGWLATVAVWNPVTYILAGLRALIYGGWLWGDILAAIAAIAAVGVVTQTMAFLALKGRVARG